MTATVNEKQTITAALLAANATAISTLVLAQPDEALRWRPAPGEWSVLEVVGHLLTIDADAFGKRVRAALADDDTVYAQLDVVGIANARGDNEADPVALLESFSRGRRDIVSLVSGLSAADLDRTFNHAALGKVPVGQVIEKWAPHDYEHIAQIATNLRGYLAEQNQRAG